MWTADGYYVQIEGLAMGSELSPLLANIFLARYDAKFREMNHKLFHRYVDDIITIVKKEDIRKKLSEINSWHKNLRFTHEEENSSGQISFLDMLIHHIDDRAQSSWFMKPTNIGLTLNYHALAPTNYKRSVVRSFVYRIYNACSTYEYVNEGLERAISILKENQYPCTFYEPILKDTIEKIYLKRKKSEKLCFDEKTTGKRLFYMQYRGLDSVKYVKNLINCGAPIIPIYTTRQLKTMLPSLKPMIEKNYTSNVIYKVRCPGCDSCYVGMSSRHLITRITEHFRPT